MVDAVFSGILLGTAGHALVSVSPLQHPYAFCACAVGFCHALASLAESIACEDRCTLCFKRLTCSCIEIMTLPMLNIEFYLKSEQSSPLALGHGLFVVPLAFDLLTKVSPSAEGEDDSTRTLKDLTILGNIVSLLFLAANENNAVYGMMVVAAFIAKYGAMFMDSLITGTGECTGLSGYSLLFGLVPMINNLLNEGKSPIIVGGTNYYIEALLWDILISNPTDGVPHMKINSDSSSEENSAMSDNNANSTTSENSENWLFITESEMLTMSSELLYNHLRKIDPVTAQRIHPNNKRKIMSSELQSLLSLPYFTCLLLKIYKSMSGDGLKRSLRYRRKLLNFHSELIEFKILIKEEMNEVI
uniref:Uncharacterized protein n=1 Tax=Glossina pallidipes TaxID=7398 RepID=A0A1A9ZZD1_GLOPL